MAKNACTDTADNTAINATVNDGTGSVTIFGASGTSVNLVGSSQNTQYIIAGAGNETLNAAGSSSPDFIAMGVASVSAVMI